MDRPDLIFALLSREKCIAQGLGLLFYDDSRVLLPILESSERNIPTFEQHISLYYDAKVKS